MKFRDDIDPEKTWIISDTHFGHDNIVGFCFRPEDHEQVMIAEWRAHVPDDATVLHLGDLAYKGNARFKNLIAPELTGARKLLILGNHDRQRYSFYRACGFNIVRPFAIPYGRFKGCSACGTRGVRGYVQACWACEGTGYHPYRVSFSHYQWNFDEEGGEMPPNDVRIHGHIHNNGYTRDGFVPFLRQHINMSAEQTKYRPVNLKLLLDAALMGEYPATTQEQIDEVRAKKQIAKENNNG